jgi:hypothetical protein
MTDLLLGPMKSAMLSSSTGTGKTATCLFTFELINRIKKQQNEHAWRKYRQSLGQVDNSDISQTASSRQVKFRMVSDDEDITMGATDNPDPNTATSGNSSTGTTTATGMKRADKSVRVLKRIIRIKQSDADLFGLQVFRPNLVVAPVSVLPAWVDDHVKMNPNSRVFVYYGVPTSGIKFNNATVINPKDLVRYLERWCCSGERYMAEVSPLFCRLLPK